MGSVQPHDPSIYLQQLTIHFEGWPLSVHLHDPLQGMAVPAPSKQTAGSIPGDHPCQISGQW